MLSKVLIQITNNKFGVEIGGPSPENIIYENAISMDNVIFSKDTIWACHDEEYNYYKNKKGKVIINDSVNIFLVNDETYDFCFASHCLEHIANPLKAIDEWLRIVKKNGYIIIIVPESLVVLTIKEIIQNFQPYCQNMKIM
jgi:SAM-dependent methyltransferase